MLFSDQALLIDLLRSFWSTNEKDPGHPTGAAIFKGARLLRFLSKTRQERKLPRWLNDAEVGVQRVAEDDGENELFVSQSPRQPMPSSQLPLVRLTIRLIDLACQWTYRLMRRIERPARGHLKSKSRHSKLRPGPENMRAATRQRNGIRTRLKKYYH